MLLGVLFSGLTLFDSVDSVWQFRGLPNDFCLFWIVPALGLQSDMYN